MISQWLTRNSTWWQAGIALLLVVLLSVGSEAQETEAAKLYQNYPNPFSQATEIKYYLPLPGQVKIIVQNMLGSELGELINERKDAGESRVRFEGTNLPSGQYSYTLTYTSDDGRIQSKLTRKMYLVR